MKRTISLVVQAAPPAKDGGFSIRNPNHSHYRLVTALRDEMRKALRDGEPFTGVPVRLEMHYERASGRADALNVINGVADVIQLRCHSEMHRCDVWLVDDDAWIREFHYSEEAGERDLYEIVVTEL